MNTLSSFPSSLVSASLPKQSSRSKFKILPICQIKPPTLSTTSSFSSKPIKSHFDKLLSLVNYGAFFVAVEALAALAVTGENNNEEDLTTTLISAAILAFGYFILAPVVVVGAIYQLQETFEGSYNGIPLVYPER